MFTPAHPLTFFPELLPSREMAKVELAGQVIETAARQVCAEYVRRFRPIHPVVVTVTVTVPKNDTELTTSYGVASWPDDAPKSVVERIFGSLIELLRST